MDVLESRNWGGYPFPNRLATEFAEKFAAAQGAKYGCCVANGTLALTIALQAAGIGFGDEVVVPAYTWDGTATAVLAAGGVPIFADIDPDTYCLDPASVEKAITPRTRALLPVHLAMRVADMDALSAIAREHSLITIEDCAHVHGGQFRGRGAGSIGELGCFSFQSSKLMTAGEGGMVLSSNLEYFELVETIVNCGRASRTDRFRRRRIGSNYRMTEFQAAILLGQLEMLPELAARRAKNAAILSQALASIPGIRPLPPQPALTSEAIYCYVFQFSEQSRGVSRDMFVAALDAEGIPSDGRFYEPVYRSDLFRVNRRDFPQLPETYGGFDCPVSERAAYHEAVWLPQFVLLGGEDDIGDIAHAIGKVCRSLPDLAGADPALAGPKAMSRAERPRVEKGKNY